MTLQRFLAQGKPVSAFKEEMQTFYEATSTRVDYIPLGDSPPFVDLHLRSLQGGICLVEAQASPYRNRVLGASQNDTDVLKLGITLKGKVYTEQAGTYSLMNTGGASMVAAEKTGCISASVISHTLAVAIPRERLALRLDNLDRVLRNGLGCSPELRLLQTYTASLLQEEGDYESYTEFKTGEHICDLINLLLGAGQEDAELGQKRGARVARLVSIKSDIAANLSNPELSIDWIARRHGIGRRSIRNLFYGENTNFTDHVLELRLELAHSLLTSLCHNQRSIMSIAMEAGFSDISWFNRTFRRRYDMTPKEIREKARHDAAVSLN